MGRAKIFIGDSSDISNRKRLAWMSHNSSGTQATPWYESLSRLDRDLHLICMILNSASCRLQNGEAERDGLRGIECVR